MILGNRVNVYRRNLHTPVYHNGHDNADVEPNTIRKLRQELELDDAHGYERDIFYNALPRISDFVLKYRTVLNRLAKD
jgi:hypothetical protein